MDDLMFMPCCWVDEKECWKYVLGQEAIVLQNNRWKKAFCALNWRSEGPSVDLSRHVCMFHYQEANIRRNCLEVCTDGIMEFFLDCIWKLNSFKQKR